jgi:hypothetical protein
MNFDESMLVIYSLHALPRDAYRLLLKDVSDRLDDKGADSLSITNMVSSTMLLRDRRQPGQQYQGGAYHHQHQRIKEDANPECSPAKMAWHERGKNLKKGRDLHFLWKDRAYAGDLPS